jgi:hypothetical protein
MPADRPNIGMGRRRQGDTEPDRSDDSSRSVDRAIDDAPTADDDYERGKEAGAHSDRPPHDPMKPGTRSTVEDAGL